MLLRGSLFFTLLLIDVLSSTLHVLVMMPISLVINTIVLYALTQTFSSHIGFIYVIRNKNYACKAQ